MNKIGKKKKVCLHEAYNLLKKSTKTLSKLKPDSYDDKFFERRVQINSKIITGKI